MSREGRSRWPIGGWWRRSSRPHLQSSQPIPPVHLRYLPAFLLSIPSNLHLSSTRWKRGYRRPKWTSHGPERPMAWTRCPLCHACPCQISLVTWIVTTVLPGLCGDVFWVFLCVFMNCQQQLSWCGGRGSRHIVFSRNKTLVSGAWCHVRLYGFVGITSVVKSQIPVAAVNGLEKEP